MVYLFILVFELLNSSTMNYILTMMTDFSELLSVSFYFELLSLRHRSCGYLCQTLLIALVEMPSYNCGVSMKCWRGDVQHFCTFFLLSFKDYFTFTLKSTYTQSASIDYYCGLILLILVT